MHVRYMELEGARPRGFEAKKDENELDPPIDYICLIYRFG